MRKEEGKPQQTRKGNGMKTYNVVFFGKGGYVDARVGGRQVSNVYCKTKAEIAARVADLKAEGYEQSK